MTASAGPGGRWLRRLVGYCWRFPRLLVFALGGSLVATVVTVVIPLIQRDIVNNAILAHRQPIWLGAAALVIAAIVNFAGVFTRRYLGGRMSLDVQHDLRTEMFAALSRLDGARQDQLHTGQIVSRSISDVNMIQGLLAMIPYLLGNVLLFVLSLVAMAWLSPLLTMIALAVGPALGQVGVLVFGGWLAIRGEINLGTFFAFSSYIAQLVGPVRSLTGLITLGQEARASVIRVYEVIDSRPVLTQKPGAIDLPPGASDVELYNVTFGYLPSAPVLRGLSLRVRPGETVALVGTSGSGKSTISLLLPRFYDVTGGAVRIGGQDVRDLNHDSLRAAIGLVMEDSFLFSDTIRANISYG